MKRIAGNFYNHLKKNPSAWLIVFLSLFLTFQLYQYAPWKKNKVLVHDMEVYYSYLPATFIYQDWSFSYIPEIRNELPDGVNPYVSYTENGKPVQKTTMGVAIMQAPFFLIGQGLGNISGYPSHGYSALNQNFFSLGALFYVILSIVFFRKLFRLYFNELITCVLLLSMYLGTNIFSYTFVEGPMAHSHNLALISMLFYFTIKWLDNPRYGLTVLLGVIIGLMILIRPTNIIFVSVLILFGIAGLSDMKERVKLLLKRYFKILIMVLSAFGIFFIQMVYWKTQTGQWLYFSYEGEQFYFDNPHIIEGLFGYRKGLLVYSPVLIFGFAGFLLMIFRRDLFKQWRTLIMLIVPLYIYVMLSWWCWWYGGGFGQRGLIEIFPLLFLAIGVLLKVIHEYKKKLLWVILPFFVFAIYLNYKQTHQFVKGLIHYDSMTKASYWEIFLRPHHTVDFYDYLSSPDYDNAREGQPEYAGWRELNAENRYSNVLYLSDAQITDSIEVKGRLFDDIKPAFLLLHMIISPDTLYSDSDFVSVPVTASGFRDIPFKVKLPVMSLEELDGRKLKIYMYYSGKGRALYQSIEFAD